MKRILCIAVLALACQISVKARDYAPLDSLLNKFYEALQSAAVEEKTAEFDSMIESCRDSLTRQHIALGIFEHYKEPPVMGDEEVAIHIYDRWFADGTVKFPGDMYKMEAELFVNFNRSTLIGAQAPPIEPKDRRGRKVDCPQKGKVSILYFFDTSCAKCALESKVLPGILDKADFPLNFYAVYCGQNKKAWRRFRREFRPKSRLVKVLHCWDPGVETNYLKLYGVISTPKLYMTEPGGLVMGRRLEAETLLKMFPIAATIQKVYEKESQN